jgi:hypothetical protein
VFVTLRIVTGKRYKEWFDYARLKFLNGLKNKVVKKMEISFKTRLCLYVQRKGLLSNTYTSRKRIMIDIKKLNIEEKLELFKKLCKDISSKGVERGYSS